MKTIAMLILVLGASTSVVAEEARTYACVGQNGLVVRMVEGVGCDPERDVPRAVRALVAYGYEQDKKRGYITEREMRREIRAELKTYRCEWEQK